MATVIRNTAPEVPALVTAINGARVAAVGSSFHPDASEVVVTAATATNLATSLTLVNQLRAVFEFHKADTVAHKAADATTMTAPAATDLATAITLANELKADYNVHRASTTYHYTADSTNAVAATNASDQDTLNTLVNEIKTDLNAHMAGAPAGASLRLSAS